MKTKSAVYRAFLLIFFSTVEITFAQVQDVNGMPDSGRNMQTIIQPLHEILKSSYTCDSVRNIGELNTVTDADAYAWLSTDGLRIYYTRASGATNTIYQSSRASLSSPFVSPVPADPIFNGSFSAWFSDNEKETFFKGPSSLMYSNRISSSTAFATPTTVVLHGMPASGFFAGPSLAPGMQEMYLFTYLNPSQTYIMRLIKTGNFDYTVIDTLDVPPGRLPGPGQLSKNGLRYYFSLDSMGITRIYRCSRMNITATFGPAVKFTPVYSTGSFNGQPSVNAGENVFAWTGNFGSTWAGNDLYTLCLGTAGTTNTAFPESPRSCLLVPNPSQGQFSLKLPDNEYAQTFHLEILDASGKLVYENYITGKDALNLDFLFKGLYLIRLNGQTSSYTTRLIIN
ncbi:MAG TPA: T9SS type A sorting domain-containing protein [Bacteroidia bacterium]|nr:T9SS type A sorting domain-containing protein [Bacteroidia bacterium]